MIRERFNNGVFFPYIKLLTCSDFYDVRRESMCCILTKIFNLIHPLIDYICTSMKMGMPIMISLSLICENSTCIMSCVGKKSIEQTCVARAHLLVLIDGKYHPLLSQALGSPRWCLVGCILFRLARWVERKDKLVTKLQAFENKIKILWLQMLRHMKILHTT
jgi:hypothetical protein